MDDVSVSNGTAEMLLNGDFESGFFSPGWTKSMPNGNCAVQLVPKSLVHIVVPVAIV
jgi:hypothetical protein